MPGMDGSYPISTPPQTRQWVLADHPAESEKLDARTAFRLECFPLPQTPPHPDQILVRTKYIANAPGLRVLLEKTPSDREFAPVSSVKT